MNKKVYISPVTEVTRLMIGRPLCIGSTGSENPTDGLDDDDPLTNGGDDPGSFSRRGRNQWDDEEDEEDHHGSSRDGWYPLILRGRLRIT